MNAPQDRDAERALLACLLTGHAVIDDVAAMLQGRDFYDPRHERVFDACMTVSRKGGRVDRISLPVQAADKPTVVDLNIDDQPGVVPALATVYAQQILDAALRRRLQDAGTRVTQLALQAEDITQATEDAKRLVDEAAATARPTEGGTSVGAGLEEAMDWLQTPPVGADTPWAEVNQRTNGLLSGQMITVAARPGGGKSLALMQVGLFTAMQGRPVHIATLEMSRNEYMSRILSCLSGVDLGRMLRREMSDAEWLKVGQAGERIRDIPLYLDERPGQSMAQVRAAARATQRKYGQGLGLVGIDYAQLVAPADRRLPRQEQVAQISRDTKLLAKEFGCPVMLLAQLNRGNTQRQDPRPMVSDLRESGALEQDSDQVWLLHRPDQYDPEDRPGEVELIVGKNRNALAPISVALSFQGHYARIVAMV